MIGGVGVGAEDSDLFADLYRYTTSLEVGSGAASSPLKVGGGDVYVMMVAMRGRYAG